MPKTFQALSATSNGSRSAVCGAASVPRVGAIGISIIGIPGISGPGYGG